MNGNSSYNFTDSKSLAVDGFGDIYADDVLIHKFSPNTRYLGELGAAGSGEGQFHLPWGLAVDGLGNIYVADMGNNRIQILDSHGKFLTAWGSPGSGKGQFKGPYGVAVDGSGNVYVADLGNHRVQKFALN